MGSNLKLIRVFDPFFCVVFELLLGCRNLLDHDPHHGVPPGIGIRPGFLPHTVPHIYPHSDGSCRNSLAITCNVMHPVYVGVCFAVVWSNVNKTINGKRTVTFCTVEGEIPALTAIQTESYPEVTVVFHFQSCIMGLLGKNAILKT